MDRERASRAQGLRRMSSWRAILTALACAMGGEVGKRRGHSNCSAAGVFPITAAVPDLAPEREIEEFQRLKIRLADLWRLVFPRDDQAYTSVVVPSLTLDGAELAKLRGATFYEER